MVVWLESLAQGVLETREQLRAPSFTGHQLSVGGNRVCALVGRVAFFQKILSTKDLLGLPH